MSDSVAEIGEGNMDVSIEVASKDEIADLAESFNTMVSNLKEVTASRKSLNEEIVIRRNTEEKIKTINRQLRRNEEYLRKLNCLQTELLKPGTIAEKSKIVTDAVVRIFDADFCRIWLAAKGDRCDTGCIHADVTEEPHVCKYRDKCLYLTSSSGRYTHIDGEVHQRVPFGCYKIGRVAADHESKFLTNDVIHDPRVHDHDWAAQCGLVSFAGYQLRPPGGQTIGVLALFSKHPISPDEDAFLENLANTTAQVMQTARTEEELEQTVHALEEVNTELKDFVYIASHDLREPLRKISSFGELLRDSLADKLEPDDVENFEFMIDGADRMTKMIEGLLVYSRLNKDNEAFEAVDLNEIVEQLKQLELNILLAETGAVIEVSENMPKVLGDETQIKQVLQNFISNGIKYRAKDVQPRITITAQQINEREVKVQVRDNGIGIEEKYYSDVFKMFRRLHSRQEYKGTGIGLAVCKKIIDKHKGRIGVESEPGKGTTFFFILSVAKETVPSQEMATVA
ncbi:MAG: GAF domain-containing protein [Planctomycetes bacterium]|nr:GAF domain-containing protein [Planctomycetota bacterium]